MNVIFLDFDGVLNGYNFWTDFGWKIACSTHCKKIKDLYRKITDPFGIHRRKVRLLAKIVHKTNARVVLTSSWRNKVWDISYDTMEGNARKLSDLFNKYNIAIFGIVLKLPDGDRCDEISKWLSDHKGEVDNFVILDDERSMLENFVGKGLVQTSSVKKGELIMGHWKENTGLKRKHVRQACKILNGGR